MNFGKMGSLMVPVNKFKSSVTGCGFGHMEIDNITPSSLIDFFGQMQLTHIFSLADEGG